MVEERQYYVQFVVIKEVKVDTYDELQAERLAYQELSQQDKGAAIALRVLNRDNELGDDDLGQAGLGGALAFDDPYPNWLLCKNKFDALNLDWVQ